MYTQNDRMILKAIKDLVEKMYILINGVFPQLTPTVGTPMLGPLLH